MKPGLVSGLSLSAGQQPPATGQPLRYEQRDNGAEAVSRGIGGIGEVAWEALYRRLERPLFNLAYRYVWDVAAAEDVVHQAFLNVWQRRNIVEGDTVERYLWVATRNVALKRRRWRRLREWVPLSEDTLAETQGPEGDTHDAQREIELRRAIDALPEKLRSALLLAEYSSLSYEEAAGLLAISPGTFASRRHLALQRLREQLKGREDEL